MEKPGTVLMACGRSVRLDALADFFDDAGGFVAEAGGQTRLFEVLAAGVEGFGAIEPDCLDTNADFAGLGMARGLIFKLRTSGPPSSWKRTTLGIRFSLVNWMAGRCAGCREYEAGARRRDLKDGRGGSYYT